MEIMENTCWADEYADQLMRDYIRKCYNERHRAAPTPFTNPELFDPLNPPQGYRYDPYYECWVKQ